MEQILDAIRLEDGKLALERVATDVTALVDGVAERARAHIFDRFYQAHADSYLSGLGLGLYVSRQIVELHGGALDAAVPVEGGTRFTARFPVGSPHPTSARAEETVR